MNHSDQTPNPDAREEQRGSLPSSSPAESPRESAPPPMQAGPVPQPGEAPPTGPPRIPPGALPPNQQGYQPPHMQPPSMQPPPMQGGQRGIPPRPTQPMPGYGGYPSMQQGGMPPGGGGYGAPPPGYTGGVRPPFSAPEPRKVKRSRIPLIIGILVLLFVVGPAALVLVGGLIMTGSSSRSGFSFNPFGDRIAILQIEGVLGQGTTYREANTDRLAEIVTGWADDTKVKGMVLDINSPGGSVTPTWELYEAIMYFKSQGKPVYASMGETAASGGYLLAMSADQVYATKSTLTGSIGVIFSLMGYEELFDKIGLESRPIKSGEFKDIGSGTRPMTEAEKVLLEELIGNIYDQFLELVVENRMEAVREKMAENQGVLPADITDAAVEEEIRRLCDGRIFSGEQAYWSGMVDHVGYSQDAISDLKAALGLSEDTMEVMTPKLPPPGLFGMMTRTAEMLQSRTAGMPVLEYRFTM